MNAIPFLVLVSFHHLPSLCSCPTPATRYRPSLENDRQFIKPGWMKEREREREREGGGGGKRRI